MDIDPLSIIFVKSDSKGDRLLFRYPFVGSSHQDNSNLLKKKNPYALLMSEGLETLPPRKLSQNKTSLAYFADDILSNLFAVKQELSETKFELKVNDIRFVGHPTMVHSSTRKGKSGNNSLILINIVFSLHATADHSIVKCYHELSKRFGVALRHEERRSGYVFQEIRTMISVHDDYSREDASMNPFEVILERCSLARDLRSTYSHLKSSGLVELRINRWISVSFCLPQKVHQLQNQQLVLRPHLLDKCYESIRPYHGLLLLIEASQLVGELAPDASPALIRLLKIYSPLKSLQALSADTDITLTQIFNLACHLAYWGKAIFIYPLCETNVYMTAHGGSIYSQFAIAEKFAELFPGHSLNQVMSEFAQPTSVGERISPLSPDPQTELQIIIWLLQQRLILQLHTYIYYMPTARGLPGQEGSCSSRDEMRSSSDDTDTGETLSDSLRRLPKGERIFLSNIGGDHIKLLVRLILLDYLEGEHHLEEIMYRENLRRSQLLQLLDRFREVLVTFEAEDPALAIFYPQPY